MSDEVVTPIEGFVRCPKRGRVQRLNACLNCGYFLRLTVEKGAPSVICSYPPPAPIEGEPRDGLAES